MKAIVWDKYGSPNVLKLVEIKKPIPKDNELLIKIFATTVTAGDARMRSGSVNFLMKLPFKIMFGWKKPRHLGFEFAGEIEEVGKDVSLFSKGDQLFGLTSGLDISTYAEYISIPEKWKGGLLGNGVLAKKPANISFDEAAAAPVGGMAALYLMKKANIQAGQEILIYGASGSVGTFALQIAKTLKARITAICSSVNSELVRSLGADEVIDYTKKDFTKTSQKYDLIFDAVGKISKAKCKNLLKKNGLYLSIKSPTEVSIENFVHLMNLLENGDVKAVIDRKYPLEKICEAHRYVEQGHKKGNVVINTQ